MDKKLHEIKILSFQKTGGIVFIDGKDISRGTLEANLNIKGGEIPQLILKQEVKIDSIELDAEVKEIKISEMNFGQALEKLNHGEKVARNGWNGKDMCVEKVVLQIMNDNLQFIDNPCLILKNVHGKFNTWIPSITDLFAEDWTLID
jgi:hypothetical protein